MHDVQQIPRLEALKAQRKIVARAIGAHQVLHDAVELPAARRVRARHAERPHDALEEWAVNAARSGASSSGTPEMSSAAAVYAIR